MKAAQSAWARHTIREEPPRRRGASPLAADRIEFIGEWAKLAGGE